MTRLLIVAPPRVSEPPIQYLDLEILVGYLRRAGHTVSILEWAGDKSVNEGGEQSCGPMTPRVVYYHLASRKLYQAFFEARGRIAGWGKGPILVAGGYFASRNDFAVLESIQRLDGIVRGELERPMLVLLESASSNGKWRQSPGLTVRGPNGPIRNPASELLALDELPAAAEDLFDSHGARSEQEVLFNRGCNSDCQYCGFQVFYQESFPGRSEFWRSRSAGAIVDEIEQYAKKQKIRRFAFNAAVFFGYDERGSEVVENVAQEILRRNLDISYRIVTHPQHLLRNERLLPLLKASGLDHVYLGLDSGSKRALMRYHVDFTVEDGLRALGVLHLHRVELSTGFIFYDPYMTRTELWEQLEFLRHAAPFFSHLPRPYPFYLDRELLHTTLSVNLQMPFIARLRRDGLVSLEENLGDVPKARFADPAVARFHRIHHAVDRRCLRKLRPLLWNRRCVEEHEELRLLPLDLLEHLLEMGLASGEETKDEGVAQARRWLADRLRGSFDRMIATAGLVGARKASLEAMVP